MANRISTEIDAILLQQERKKRGLSQRRLAKKCGLSENTIIKAEKGLPVSFGTIKQLCDFLSLDYGLLVLHDQEYLIPTTPSPQPGPGLVDLPVELPFDGTSDTKDVVEFLQKVMKKYGIDRIELTDARPGSIHALIRLPQEDAQKLIESGEKNELGEILIATCVPGKPSTVNSDSWVRSRRGDLSVTRWLHELQHGNEFAARRLWDCLHQRLLRLAQKELEHRSTTEFSEEDVALSSFDSLCSAVQKGRYNIDDREELWRLLAVITVNKARRRARDENRLRRGGGHKRQYADLLHTLASREPDAGTARMMREECQSLLARLPQPEVQLVAVLKVEGYTNEEVAQQLGCSRRAVQRRLNIIRELWANEDPRTKAEE